jgi:hypothetical protein
MILTGPFVISPRLLPALRIGDGWVQLEMTGRLDYGRNLFKWTIDIDGKKGPDDGGWSGEDLKGPHGLQEGFASLLVFLDAAQESYRYRISTGRTGENEDLFPPEVVEWAYQNSDEIGLLSCELSETDEELIEE